MDSKEAREILDKPLKPGDENLNVNDMVGKSMMLAKAAGYDEAIKGEEFGWLLENLENHHKMVIHTREFPSGCGICIRLTQFRQMKEGGK